MHVPDTFMAATMLRMCGGMSKQMTLSSGGACPQRLGAPSADEIDAIAPKRETAQREMERRIVAQVR